MDALQPDSGDRLPLPAAYSWKYFFGGPSSATHAPSPLLLTPSLPPLFIIFPSTEPSTTTSAPGSIVRLPRRFPRTCKKQSLLTIVSRRTELLISDEVLTT